MSGLGANVLHPSLTADADAVATVSQFIERCRHADQSGIAGSPGSRRSHAAGRGENEVKTKRAADKWARAAGIDFESLTNVVVVGLYHRRR